MLNLQPLNRRITFFFFTWTFIFFRFFRLLFNIWWIFLGVLCLLMLIKMTSVDRDEIFCYHLINHERHFLITIIWRPFFLWVDQSHLLFLRHNLLLLLFWIFWWHLLWSWIRHHCRLDSLRSTSNDRRWSWWRVYNLWEDSKSQQS